MLSSPSPAARRVWEISEYLPPARSGLCLPAGPALACVPWLACCRARLLLVTESACVRLRSLVSGFRAAVLVFGWRSSAMFASWLWWSQVKKFGLLNILLFLLAQAFKSLNKG